MTLILCFDLRVWEEIYEEAEGQSIKNPTYVGKFCEKCPHYVPSDWVWAPKEKTFSSRSWRTDQEWVMTKSRIISRPAWSNSVDKYSLWPLTFMFEPKDMARLQTWEERAQDNFKKDSTMTTFP